MKAEVELKQEEEKFKLQSSNRFQSDKKKNNNAKPDHSIRNRNTKHDVTLNEADYLDEEGCTADDSQESTASSDFGSEDSDDEDVICLLCGRLDCDSESSHDEKFGMFRIIYLQTCML